MGTSCCLPESELTLRVRYWHPWTRPASRRDNRTIAPSSMFKNMFSWWVQQRVTIISRLPKISAGCGPGMN